MVTGYLISMDTFSSRLPNTGAARGSPYRRPDGYSLISEIPEGGQRCWETYCPGKACVTPSRKKQTKHKKRTRLKSKRRWRPGWFLIIFYCVYMGWEGSAMYVCVPGDQRTASNVIPKELPTSYFAFETWSLINLDLI